MDPTRGSEGISPQYGFDNLEEKSQRDVDSIISKLGAEKIQNLPFGDDTIESLEDFNISTPSGAASEQAGKITNFLSPPEESTR